MTSFGAEAVAAPAAVPAAVMQPSVRAVRVAQAVDCEAEVVGRDPSSSGQRVEQHQGLVRQQRFQAVGDQGHQTLTPGVQSVHATKNWGRG